MASGIGFCARSDLDLGSTLSRSCSSNTSGRGELTLLFDSGEAGEWGDPYGRPATADCPTGH